MDLEPAECSLLALINPKPNRNREAAMHVVCAAPALPDSNITNVLQYPIVTDWEKWQNSLHLSPELTPHPLTSPASSETSQEVAFDNWISDWESEHKETVKILIEELRT